MAAEPAKARSAGPLMVPIPQPCHLHRQTGPTDWCLLVRTQGWLSFFLDSFGSVAGALVDQHPRQQRNISLEIARLKSGYILPKCCKLLCAVTESHNDSSGTARSRMQHWEV